MRQINSYRKGTLFIIILLLFSLLMHTSSLVVDSSSLMSRHPQNLGFETDFNGTHAKNYIQTQLDFGYRIPGTLAAEHCIEWIAEEMSRYGTLQWLNFTKSDIYCRNLLVKLHPAHSKIIIFAAHYDSRAVAEKETNTSLQHTPILGANDGGSGVAVMLELGSLLVEFSDWNYSFWFLFFDAEDQGSSRGISGLSGFDWCEGSMYCAQLMNKFPDLFFHSNQSITSIEAFILFDMVGGDNLKFIRESHSDSALREKIFTIGRNLGYTTAFPAQSISYSIVDDHVAFADLGIPTVDLIIDFWSLSAPWSYHHTLADSIDHVSAASLEITGRTILQFIYDWCYTNNGSETSNSFIISYWVEKGAIFASGTLCGVLIVLYRMKRRMKSSVL